MYSVVGQMKPAKSTNQSKCHDRFDDGLGGQRPRNSSLSSGDIAIEIRNTADIITVTESVT